MAERERASVALGRRRSQRERAPTQGPSVESIPGGVVPFFLLLLLRALALWTRGLVDGESVVQTADALGLGETEEPAVSPDVPTLFPFAVAKDGLLVLLLQLTTGEDGTLGRGLTPRRRQRQEAGECFSPQTAQNVSPVKISNAEAQRLPMKILKRTN